VEKKVAFQILSGEWSIAIDPENRGRDERWFEALRSDSETAPVPGLIQDVYPNYHGVAWYWHTFRVKDGAQPTDQTAPCRASSTERLLLRFGAVDYLGEVWLNGQYAGGYEGGETPFELDVTEAIRADGDNLLAVRVLNPSDTPIDGYVLKEVPHSNRTNSTKAGSSTNMGGITYPVELRGVPTVYIGDLFVRPDLHTGKIAVTVAVRNSRSTAVQGLLTVSASPDQAGQVIAQAEQTVELPPGLSEHEMVVQVPQPRLWDLEDPHLYRVTAAISAVEDPPQGKDQPAHQQAVRCGFRELRVVDGYFYLNGRRLFLKSAHTGRGSRRDMLNARAAGFNMVRFIAGVADPAQLDFCDELGLMVYEECLASWLLADSPKMGERYDRSTAAMIRRDRNHPCITIWGLLNETENGPVFRQAVAFLPKLRRLDPTRLVLLSSGRWDGDPSIGSVSNPGSVEWEPEWGVEGLNPPQVNPKHWWGYMDRAGDAHHYPFVPLPPQGLEFFRNLGRQDKPVFLSEFGIGPVQDVIRDWRYFQQKGVNEDRDDVGFLRAQAQAFVADWRRLGFDDVFPFPEDFLRESQRLAARHRTLSFDLIRCNPKICGHNLTALNDGLTGEGLWNCAREWKPATYDAVSDGWAPLRWCLLAGPMHGYAGREITFEATLANEGALPPGEYPVRFRILGPAGLAWEKPATVTIPDPSPLAIPVLEEKLKLSGPAGQYVFAANMEKGGAPSGGRLTFYLSDPAELPKVNGRLSLWGLYARSTDWLMAHGLSCRPLPAEDAGEPGEVVLVYKPQEGEITPARMAGLFERVAAGDTVVFLNHKALGNAEGPTGHLPFQNKGTCYAFTDWLYHKECVAKRHPVFAGLQGPGILDWDYYDQVIPHEIYEGLATPDETIAASFVTAHHRCPGGYGCGLLVAAYGHGQGKIILSTLHLMENLDAHPAADRLLLNLVGYAMGGR
jgi:Glycosyl hydrolases family 2, sugar binding domain/Glycosyl hydrolases family 2/Glycosyl hydrolases family 2, TIM barrel domain